METISNLSTASAVSERNRRRANILMDAARGFSLIKRPSPQEISNFKELFYQLIETLSPSERRIISAVLARGAFTPRAIAIYLSQDSIDIAAPFLLFSPVLKQFDLNAIALKKGQNFQDIIDRRNVRVESDAAPLRAGTISSAVAEKLKPAEPVMSNKTIETSAVSKKAAPLATSQKRPRTPEIANNALLEMAPEQKQDQWLSGDEIVALASVGGRLGRSASPAKAENAPSTTQNEKLFGSSVAPVSRPDSPELSKADIRILTQYAMQKNHQAFATHIENLCGLESDATIRLLSSDQGDEIVYLIKALNIPSPHSLQMMLLLLPRLGKNFSAYTAAKALLNELNTGICQMIFNEIGAKFVIAGAQNWPPVPESAPARDIIPDYKKAVRSRRENLEARRTTPKPAKFSRYAISA